MRAKGLGQRDCEKHLASSFAVIAGPPLDGETYLIITVNAEVSENGIDRGLLDKDTDLTFAPLAVVKPRTDSENSLVHDLDGAPILVRVDTVALIILAVVCGY